MTTADAAFVDPLLDPIFMDADMSALFTPRAFFQRMLDVEAALARAQADLGVIPKSVAKPIAAACRADLYDFNAIGTTATDAGNLAIPMVKALTAAVDGKAKGFVHWGATSQDIVDTATVLQIKDALALFDQRLRRLGDGLATMVKRHRRTPMVGRTWLQHALPTTFGLKAAGWLDVVLRHGERLDEVRRRAVALQFGGASGTLASLGEAGMAVAERLAKHLGLTVAATPWHTGRDRVAEVAALGGLITGTLGKIARDVSLMMQTDVGEVFEAAASGRGGSSTMPHKRNPVACASILAAATMVPGLVATMLTAQVQEHERAAGTWSAEWPTLPDILKLTGGALLRTADLIDGLEIDARRMRQNLDATGGLILAEAVMMTLGERIGRGEAHHLLETASRKAIAERRHLRDVLANDEHITRHLDEGTLKRLFDPLAYLGSAQQFVDRALAAYRRRPKQTKPRER
jgi:3-carboxy-cis,cis-muconate cycloisomerase